MTKIDLGLSQNQKDTDDKIKEVQEPTTEVDLTDEQQQRDEQRAKELKAAEEERISIEEILASVGLDTGVDDEPCIPPPPTMDWGFIRQLSKAQVVLAVISLTCITLTVVLGGMVWYKFAATIWTLFLLLTGYTGYCAGSKKCYTNMVGYCIMNSFQTLLHWGSMAWLIYMIYCMDDTSMHRQREAKNNDPRMDIILFLELGESLALLGTVLTGLFGMVACCKGFGRLLSAQDRRIMEEIQEMQKSLDKISSEENVNNTTESALDSPC